MGMPEGVPAQHSSDSTEAQRPDFRLLRQQEDWRSYEGETEGLSAVKYAPITSHRTAFVTVGGEVRSYGRWFRHEQWGAGPDRDAYLLQRLMLHGAVEAPLSAVGLRVRGFLQLKSGLVAGRSGPVYPPDRDRLGVNQGFVEVQGPRSSTPLWTLRIGRQELHYGAGRMIAVREGPNVRRGFDAVLGRYRVGPLRADVFVARPTATPPGILDNGWRRGRTLWGAHLRRERASGGALALYYFGANRTSAPLQPALHTTRHTIGGRGQGTVGRVAYDVEAAVQVGRYRSMGAERAGALRAWTAAGRVTYRSPGHAGQPTFGLMADVSSGDRGGTAALETFVAPYPAGRYTGAGSRLGPGNLVNVRPYLGVRLWGGVAMQLRGHLFSRLRATDGVYAIWGAPFRDATGKARFVGAMPELFVTWTTHRHLHVALEASHMVPGAYLSANPPAEGMTHMGLRASYVF